MSSPLSTGDAKIFRNQSLGSLEVPTLSEGDRRLLHRLLGNPLEYPPQFTEWIPRYLEVNPPQLTLDNVSGAAEDLPGMGKIWPFGTAPDGWIFANGTVVNRTDAPELFMRIGTTFNTGGETASQFRLPNIPDPATGVHWILKT
jgi:hypothetical protein